MDMSEDCSAGRPKAPPTAYFLFCASERLRVKEYIQENPLEAHSHTLSIKDLAEKWRMLSEEEKQVYADTAAERKAEYQQQLAIWNATKGKDDQPAQNSTNDEDLFPQSRVTKIAKLDPSVKHISSEAAKLLNHATVEALRQFTVRCMSCCDNSSKSLTVRDVDMMLRRGGTQLQFLRDCKYAIFDEVETVDANVPEEIEVDKDELCSRATASDPSQHRLTTRPCAPGLRGTSSAKAKDKRGAAKTMDILSYFTRQ